jgi:hypothetical protein
VTRHDSAPGPIGYKNLVSNWCQTAPYLPVLPTQPAYNHLSVNNLRFIRFHSMEEVIGSIPIRSTNYLKHLEALPFRDFVASLSQIPKPHQEPALLSLILLVLSSPGETLWKPPVQPQRQYPRSETRASGCC